MNSNLSHVLDNVEINRLADLYLSFLDMDIGDIVYRRLKNAVILCALCFDDMESVYAELESDDSSAEQIAGAIDMAISALPEPVEELFNKAYCSDGAHGFMPHHKSTDNIIAFLGKTFLYILETNYPLLLC